MGVIVTIVRMAQNHKVSVAKYLESRWGSSSMLMHGKEVDLVEIEGFVAFNGEEIAGCITFEIIGFECEIWSLNSEYREQGHGRRLTNKVIDEARNRGCKIVRVFTSNDNVVALLFYQRCGFDMVAVHHNAMDKSRKINPLIPEIGFFQIPLKHEIEFEYKL
ncbi:MAG: GNAT family N-acetyltransferase [Oscillospiraceae bacterium]|jgi:ribosomal protein S18 acetylase RimI-like enzyme|nr:GNAT family N-acetyltransferase [Oscillospiraceae bacterium]